MATSHRRSPTSQAPVAYMECAVDIPSVTAKSSIDVEIAAARAFRYNCPVAISLRSDQTAINAGLKFGVGRVVYSSGRKIQFRVSNVTAVALDPASKIFIFTQP